MGVAGPMPAIVEAHPHRDFYPSEVDCNMPSLRC